MDHPRVAVIVLHYCSLQDTVECVRALRRNDYPNFSILVIDNGSPDGSGAKLRLCLRKDEFLPLPTNTGYARGNNIGIELALRQGARYVLIVNPDVRVPSDAIRRYEEIMSMSDRIAALNSVQLQPDGRTVDSNFAYGVLRPAGVIIEEFDPTRVPLLLEVQHVFGACLMISRNALQKVGGFDPIYFAYGEETDLARRMLFHGFRLVVTRHAPVLHLRTREQTGDLSSFLAYLRLRAIYLGNLKAPTRSFAQGVHRAVRDLGSAVLGRAPETYPYTAYAIPRIHSLRVLSWLLVHLPQVWLHRFRDRHGPQYLSRDVLDAG
jgi:GT2 family glycosyltransferase